MKQPALTPVERGILIILMASGWPIKQAEFKRLHGLSVKKSHRCKLSELGLIDVSKDFHPNVSEPSARIFTPSRHSPSIP